MTFAKPDGRRKQAVDHLQLAQDLSAEAKGSSLNPLPLLDPQSGRTTERLQHSPDQPT